MADQLAKLGSEPSSSISTGVAKKVVRDWTIRYDRKHWNSLSGLKQAEVLRGTLPRKHGSC
jgi:hypothetical protein